MKKLILSMILILFTSIAWAIPPAQLPPIRATDCTPFIGDGLMCYDIDDDKFYIGNGTAAIEFIHTSGFTATRVPFADGTGSLVDDSDMTFVTDTLNITKVIAPTSTTIGALATQDRIIIQGVAKGANQFDGTLSLIDLTGAHAWNLPNLDGTIGLTANKLSDFAPTTSAELAGVISDETGSGLLVFDTSPTFNASAKVVSDDATTDAIVNVLRLDHTVAGAGVAANNIGTGLVFYSEDASGNIELAGQIAAIFPTAAHATQTSSMIFRPGINHTAAFQFQDAAGTSTILNVDTTNLRLGIGTTGPDQKLHIYGSNPVYLKLEGSGATDTAGVRVKNTSQEYIMGLDLSDKFSIFHVTSNERRLVIDSTGNVGIGTAVPDGQFSQGLANGQQISYKSLTELTTINAAATTDTAIQIPANVIVKSVQVRVTTVIPTAATFTVIGATSTTVFNTAAVSTAINSTDKGNLNAPYNNGAAQVIRITPNLTPADNTGRVRVTIWYEDSIPPTS